jgi:hypothetical protein
VQIVNLLAITWSMAKETFSIGSGARYQWVTVAFLIGFIIPLPFWVLHRLFPRHRIWAYINTSIICWYLGYLAAGINSAMLSFFLCGFVAQWWLRRHHPQLFRKYNYIVSAALDGGTQVMVFILTFAVFGGSGKERPFPYVKLPLFIHPFTSLTLLVFG